MALHRTCHHSRCLVPDLYLDARISYISCLKRQENRNGKITAVVARCKVPIRLFVSQIKRESPSEGASSRNIPAHIVFLMKEIPKRLFTLSPSPTKRAVNIVCWLMIFRQVNGINAVIFYTVDIFQEAGGILLPFLATIIVGIVQVVATCISSLLVQ